MVEAKIIEVGNTPRIAGTRISVYTILEYVQENWRSSDIAFWLDLRKDQVDVAISYIDHHKAAVMTQYEKIMERINRGNPPELQAKLDATQGSARAKLEELCRLKKQESAVEGHSGGPHPINTGKTYGPLGITAT